MASGIKNKVVIAGMGCSKFGERWSCGPDDLMVEAFGEALADAGIERDRIEAAWLGVFFDEQSTGKSSLPMSMALRLPNVPTTRVENLCATGTEALRGAVYAVAAGACDIALAHGRREAQGHGLRRLAGAHQGHVRGSVPALEHRARRIRAAGERLRRQARLFDAGAQAGDGAHLLQEPRERVAQSQGAFAQPHHRAAGPRCAGHLLPAGRARLLRRQRWRRVRHRHHTRHRAQPRQARPGVRAGAAARAQQRRGDGPPILGRHAYADHAPRGAARLRGSRHPQTRASRSI